MKPLKLEALVTRKEKRTSRSGRWGYTMYVLRTKYLDLMAEKNKYECNFAFSVNVFDNEEELFKANVNDLVEVEFYLQVKRGSLNVFVRPVSCKILRHLEREELTEYLDIYSKEKERKGRQIRAELSIKRKEQFIKRNESLSCNDDE